MADEKLQEASADLILKREERGIAVAGAFLAQITVVGTFLGAFGLLNDAGKSAVVQSGWSVAALFLAALSLTLSLSTYVLLPSHLPPLEDITDLRTFWNSRIVWRKVLLIGAMAALVGAIGCAFGTYVDVRDLLAHKPAAAVSAKFTASSPQGTASSLEGTATWSGLDPGKLTVACVFDPADNVLGAAVGAAGDDGKQTTTLTVPVTAKTGTVKISTVRLSSAPPTDEKPADTCKSKPEWEGQPTESSIAIKPS
jgi:hypothetical protein